MSELVEDADDSHSPGGSGVRAPDLPRHALNTTSRLTGPACCSQLERLSTISAAELFIDASSLQAIDAYGGAMLGAAVQSHVRGGPSCRLVVAEPIAPTAWSHLYDLMGGGQIHNQFDWTGEIASPARGHHVVLPATLISTIKIKRLVFEHALRSAVPALGLGDRAMRLLVEGGAELVANAQEHGTDSSIPPVLAVMVDELTSALQLVVLDLAPAPPSPAVSDAALKNAVQRSYAHSGALDALTRRSFGGIDFSVTLASGAAVATWRRRTSGSWQFASGPHVPGFVSGLEIHLKP